MTRSKPKVLLAMSGGVDSSVAAALLVREGYEVVGCFMRLGSPGETFDELEPYDSAGVACDASQIKIGHQGCCSINDAADARLVAAKLDIPFYVCNFKKDFARIIDYFVDEYNAGRTPNPCVRCNDWLKFGKLHDYAKQIDAEFVASGHYACIDRINGSGGECRLLRGVDHEKDQSYVLFGSPRDRLREMLLPIGGFRKTHVRELAEEFGLPVFNKPDSQEICFVPDNDYAGLVKRRSPNKMRSGAIVDTSGKVVGSHEGHQHFTIGQRRGTGVALGYPIYVVNKDAETNTITVGDREELLATSCIANESNWLMEPNKRAAFCESGPSPHTHSRDIGDVGNTENEPPSQRAARSDWIACTAKIRYNAEPVAARVRATSDSEIEVEFQSPQFAAAPGQAVVCYDGEAVICGGWIREAFSSGAPAI